MKLYFKCCIAALTCVLTVGFLIPSFISSNDFVLFTTGILLILAQVPIIGMFVIWLRGVN